MNICGLAICSADNVVIKAPDYFKEPLRDGHILFPDSLVFPRNAEKIEFPDLGMIGRFENYGFTNLKKITFNNIDYLPGGLFDNIPTLEEIEFKGTIGHFDCTMVSNCPNLRKIIFRGPISSTGGPGFAYNCPRLENVIFEGPVVGFGLSLFGEEKCPELHNYTINKGAALKVYNDSLTPKTSPEIIRKNKRLISGLERIADFQIDVLKAKNPGWMRKCMYEDAGILLPVLEKINSKKASSLKRAMDYAWTMGDDVKSNLEILKESPAYRTSPENVIKFTYAKPDNPLLTLSREHFNLDSIAGDGDDISRIKNLLYWVHNNIRHDGSNGLPSGPRNLRNIHDSAKRDSCGYNCRALAICLTEALLAEGIPARYITCESKRYDTDSDCHVICIAWSESLNKWIWVDPTFAAYVTDENGLLLHPGEVRYRLQHNMPLILNSDANWNNRVTQTKDYYLEDYMAKNLYIMSANLFNQAEPEGEVSRPHYQGQFTILKPLKTKYHDTLFLTNDDKWFWQPPTK